MIGSSGKKVGLSRGLVSRHPISSALELKAACLFFNSVRPLRLAG